MSGWRKPKCQSGKDAWRTHGDALRALERITVDNAQAVAPRAATPTGAYKCQCGAWHLGSTEALTKLERRAKRKHLREVKPKCNSGKVSYYTQSDAGVAMAFIAQRIDAPHRAYQCDRCGLWHLTTQPLRAPKPSGRTRTRHLHVAPEALVASPVLEVKPVKAYSPTDPITRARRAQWAALQGENVREHLAHPFPWKRAA